MLTQFPPVLQVQLKKNPAGQTRDGATTISAYETTSEIYYQCVNLDRTGGGRRRRLNRFFFFSLRSKQRVLFTTDFFFSPVLLSVNHPQECLKIPSRPCHRGRTDSAVLLLIHITFYLLYRVSHAPVEFVVANAACFHPFRNVIYFFIKTPKTGTQQLALLKNTFVSLFFV